jgi:hypothetical protein
MAQPLITTKLTPEALRLIRLIAADTGEKQYEVVIRVLREEARRLRLPVKL